jgi:hypothetical protein
MRFLLPSIGDLIFVALFGLLVYTNLSVRLLGDAGIGWHIRTGQLILATHTIPHVDSFSSSMAGQPWFAWEWLYDAVVGAFDSAAGLNAVVVFTAVIIALTFGCTFCLLQRRGTNLIVALPLLLLAASASMIHFLARPHVMSWFFTVLWFWILESSEQGISLGVDDPRHGQSVWWLWFLPLSMLFWVNLHGGFLLGFVLLAIYWISALWAWWKLKEDRFEDALQKIAAARRLRTLTWTGILSALATLINPYGPQLHLHIYRYLTNHFLMNHIDEFQSPNFHYVAQKCFAILLLLSLVALALKKREVRVSQILVVLFAVYSGLYASRNLPVSSLLLILIIGPWLSGAMKNFAERESIIRAPQFFHRMNALDLTLRGHLWPVTAFAATCWIAALGGKLGTTSLISAHFSEQRFPAAAVDYLETHDAQLAPDASIAMPVSIFSPDNWGGYFIYRLYPRMMVVIDDRHDFYGEEYLRAYLKALHVTSGWQDFLHQHPARYLVVPKESALANILLVTADWQPIYRDNVAIVFAPTPAQSR